MAKHILELKGLRDHFLAHASLSSLIAFKTFDLEHPQVHVVSVVTNEINAPESIDHHDIDTNETNHTDMTSEPSGPSIANDFPT